MMEHLMLVSSFHYLFISYVNLENKGKRKGKGVNHGTTRLTWLKVNKPRFPLNQAKSPEQSSNSSKLKFKLQNSCFELIQIRCNQI